MTTAKARNTGTTNVVTLYNSRENLVKGVTPVSYADINEAGNQLEDQLNAIYDSEEDLRNAVDDYLDGLYDFQDADTEETEAGVQLLNLAMEDAWASLQNRVSEFAVMAGINGNEAFQRRSNTT